MMPRSKFCLIFFKVLNSALAEPDLNGAKIACEIDMSRMHLHRHLRRYFDASSEELIRNARMAKSKTLLISTDLPINQIATRVGFRDPAYFSRVFSNTHSVSPSQFRNLNKK